MTDDSNQMDLLQDGDNDGCEGTPTAVFPAPRMEKRGRGRPKGATNRKTQAIEKLYRAKGLRDPLIAQGEIASAHPLDLHRQIVVMQAHAQGIKADQAMEAYRAGTLFGVPSIAEVIALQTKVQDQLTPYLYGKKPPQQENNDERLPMLFIDLGDDAPGGAALANEGCLSIGEAIEGQDQQNQSLSQIDTDTSHSNASHDSDKALKDKGE